MLSHKEIDDKFVSLIPMLIPIVKGVAYKNNRRHLEPDAVINEAYIYIKANPHLYTTQDQLQKIIISFVNKSIIWNNSKVNKQERVSTSEELPCQPEPIDDIDIALESKVEIEKWYSDKMCCLEAYRSQEPDRVKQVIYDVYFKKGITKGTELGKHLNVNKDYACKYIRTMKQDINEFYKNWKQ